MEELHSVGVPVCGSLFNRNDTMIHHFLPNKTRSVHAKRIIAQESILQAGQGRCFGRVIGFELSVQAEAGAVGGAQHLFMKLAEARGTMTDK